MYVCEDLEKKNVRVWVPGTWRKKTYGSEWYSDTQTRTFFSSKFFFLKCFALCFCWFVSWLLTISGSFLWRGVPMENKSPAVVPTKPSRFGTRSLQIASRRWGGTKKCKFSFNFCLFLFVSASRRWGGTREGKFFQVFPLSVLLIRVLTSHKYRVYSVAWSPDGNQIASGSQDETIKIWDSQSGDCQSTLTGHSGE